MAFTERSAATRQAILRAAREHLTTRGYEGTTIRAVASDVGVDPSMVMRYFGSKAGLFGAAVSVDLRLPDASAVSRERLGEVLARHFVARWEGGLSDEATTLLLRSSTTNPEAAARARSVFETQVLSFVRRGVGPGAASERRAGLVSAQVLGIALCRYVLELPPVVALDAEELISLLGPVLQHYLTGDLEAGVGLV
jgi:AcrR family transcriptional regulator